MHPLESLATKPVFLSTVPPVIFSTTQHNQMDTKPNVTFSEASPGSHIQSSSELCRFCLLTPGQGLSYSSSQIRFVS